MIVRVSTKKKEGKRKSGLPGRTVMMRARKLDASSACSLSLSLSLALLYCIQLSSRYPFVKEVKGAGENLFLIFIAF